MRIAFDHQIFVAQSYGGISRYITRLAEQFLLQNHDVAIFSPANRNNYLRQLPKGIVFDRSLSIFPPKTRQLFRYYDEWVLKRALCSWQPEVVHETYYKKKPSGPQNCPTVVTFHDMIHEIFLETMPSNNRTSEIKRSVAKRVDHIICVSENTRNDLISILDVPEDKTSVIYHGFERFINFSDHYYLKEFIREGPYLLYVGARDRYKNFSGFLKAYSSSRNLKSDLDVIAFGGGPFSDEEYHLIHDLDLDPERIKQLSGDDCKLGSLYMHARAFVYPSLYEGFGLPPLEAMAHNCPVISSNTSSMPEVIGDAAAFFNPYDTEAIISALESVVYDEKKRSDLIEKGNQRIQFFSWERCAEETMSVYKKVLG